MADENPEMSPFSLLPEDCIENIISLTSPKDACMAATVSLAFKSVAESDTVWRRFLPPDYEEIVAGSTSPVAFSTKKELYRLLCESPILLDGGKLSFRLSKENGKKCYMLCARELQIAWVDNNIHWTWSSLPESRFSEVAELQSVCWLDICGTMQAQRLSPNTKYAAYLVFKLSENHHGLEYFSKATVRLVEQETAEIEAQTTTVYVVRPPRRRIRIPHRQERWFSSSRSDGWLEIKLGEFSIAEGDKYDVRIQLSETEHLNWKRGLIVEGIEVRPKEAF